MRATSGATTIPRSVRSASGDGQRAAALTAHVCYARPVVRRRSPALAAVLCACLMWAAPAHAWPVDVLVDLSAGSDEIRKLSAVSWAQSDDEAIAVAEVLPTGELLLTGKSPGRALVLLYAEGKFAV